MAFTGALEALGLMLRGSLGIPPGVVIRPASAGYGGAGSSDSSVAGASALQSMDFINSIVDITADDVCVGNSPVFVSGLDSVESPILKKRLSRLRKALNKMVRWAAVDLLKRGLSMYALQQYEDRGTECLSLVPFLESVHIYMRRNGSVFVVGQDDKVVENILIFLNYSKETLVPVNTKELTDLSGEDILYEIIPEPVQLKNVGQAAEDLARIKRALADYRSKTSRVVRFVSVDVGTAQGDRIQEVVDSVSQYLNAPSVSLQQTMPEGMGFDDGIPVVPYRRSSGKPELTTDNPSFDISNIADLDQALGEVFLGMQFPKSYADFNTSLDATTVSLLRGDIRYTRLVSRCRFLIEDTINSWVPAGLSCEEFTAGGSRQVRFKLIKLPTTEDTDVVETLSSFSEFTTGFLSGLTATESREEAEVLIDSLEELLADTSNLPAIQNWFSLVRAFVDKRFSAIEEEQEELATEAEEETPDGGGELPPMDYEPPVGGLDEGPSVDDVSASVGSEADAAGMPELE